jgi:hypothetical protein
MIIAKKNKKINDNHETGSELERPQPDQTLHVAFPSGQIGRAAPPRCIMFLGWRQHHSAAWPCAVGELSRS